VVEDFHVRCLRCRAHRVQPLRRGHELRFVYFVVFALLEPGNTDLLGAEHAADVDGFFRRTTEQLTKMEAHDREPGLIELRSQLLRRTTMQAVRLDTIDPKFLDASERAWQVLL
jgi:hypothetical protein